MTLDDIFSNEQRCLKGITNCIKTVYLKDKPITCKQCKDYYIYDSELKVCKEINKIASSCQ